MSNLPPYKLYIILRQDLASMTPGRCAAMASHATSVFEKDVAVIGARDDLVEINQAIDNWKNETKYNFGTVIVLKVERFEELGGILKNVSELSGTSTCGEAFGNDVTDPEYALLDGSVVHFVPDVQTGIYVFASDEIAARIGLKELSLL